MSEVNISTKQGNRIKTKACWFNGTTLDLGQIDNIKRFCIEFPFWAYIMHTPDDECSGLHIHFLVFSRGQISIKNVAEKLSCDFGVVQDTKQPKNYARYMIHLGWSEKKQYQLSDVVSSDIDRFSTYISDMRINAQDLYSDYLNLRSGRISRSDFVEKYKGEFNNMNFYQKIRVFSEIERVAKY